MSLTVSRFGFRVRTGVPLPSMQFALPLMVFVLLGSMPARPQQAPAAAGSAVANCASPPCPQPAKAATKPTPVKPSKPGPAKPPVTGTPPADSPKGLDIVMTCAIDTGVCTSASSKFQLPVYKAPNCPVLATALKDPKTSELPSNLQASVANFVAASVMPQPPLSVTAIDNLLVISSTDPNPAKYDAPPSKNAGQKNVASKLTPLAALEQEITQLLALLNQDSHLIPPLSVELVFPTTAISDPPSVSALQAAAGTNFTWQPLTSSKLLLSGSSTNLLTCGQWTDFLRQAGEIARAQVQVVPVYRTYEIHAGDAAAALNAGAPATGGKGAGGGAQGGGGTPSAGGSNSSATSQPGGSAAGSSATAPAGAATTGGSGTTTPAAPAAAAPASHMPAPVAPPNPTVSATNFPLGDPGDDLIVFNGSDGDAGIAEKQRILAAMDLPRPQMIINGSVLQSSTKDLQNSVKFRNSVTQFVNEQNDALQQAILVGWQVVKQRIDAGNGAAPATPFFDPEFFDYLTQQKAYNPLLEDNPAPDAIGQTLGGVGAVGPNAHPEFCAVGQYCLGYTELFKHPEPRLTDLMLTFIAAQHPSVEASQAIDCVEFWDSNGGSNTCAPKLPPQTELQTGLAKDLGVQQIYTAIQTQQGWPLLEQPCEKLDLAGVVAYTQEGAQSHLFLECFRMAVDALVRTPPSNQLAAGQPIVSALGPVRASLADFLFNYKMSQMYPHEFTAYDLTRSAVALDQSLEVLIDAFNRDIAAYQMYWQVRFEHEAKTIGKIDLFYGAVISVRTVSGNLSSASSTTQSFLNISSAPQIGTVLSSLAGAASAATPIGVLGNLSGNQAQTLTAALQSYQTTKAQIGRSLSVQVQPRSLAGASAAEMDVTFNADESAPPSYWSNPPANNTTGPDLSRTSRHDVTTHVRVDSLKLFEISTMTAILRAGRTKFPLLPPFVEIPYIGTLAGIPLPQAKSYHSSTAILSGVVVPTASDLAGGLRFRSDLVLMPLNPDPAASTACYLSFHRKLEPDGKLGPEPSGPVCHVRRATSMEDLGGRSRLIEFNRQMVECYANGNSNCLNLTFDQILAPRE